MRLRDWLIDKLGGDEPAGDPDTVVEVAVVELWRSELVVHALRERGIPAESVHEHSVMQPLDVLGPQARILVQNGRRTEAIEIIDALTSQAYGPTDD
jgi:hypothetical protein